MKQEWLTSVPNRLFRLLGLQSSSELIYQDSNCFSTLLWLSRQPLENNSPSNQATCLFHRHVFGFPMYRIKRTIVLILAFIFYKHTAKRYILQLKHHFFLYICAVSKQNCNNTRTMLQSYLTVGCCLFGSQYFVCGFSLQLVASSHSTHLLISLGELALISFIDAINDLACVQLLPLFPFLSFSFCQPFPLL